VGRIRELLAHGGIASLAALFAIAFAIFGLADPQTGGSGFAFRFLETEVELFVVTQAGVALLLVAGLLFGVWCFGRASLRECPECRSDIPRDARVCRFCTTDLPAASES